MTAQAGAALNQNRTWETLNWATIEGEVRRLQARIVSKRIFARIDAAIFRMLWQWACARHPRKGRRWVKCKYFERVGTRDWWFFGESPGEEPRFAHLRLFHAASVRIVRHATVKSEVNPYDPGWARYLDQRSKRRSKPTVSTLWASAKA